MPKNFYLTLYWKKFINLVSIPSKENPTNLFNHQRMKCAFYFFTGRFYSVDVYMNRDARSVKDLKSETSRGSKTLLYQFVQTTKSVFLIVELK